MASQLPPATPKSVLRGHQAQVHAATFLRNNQRLASGDAEGYVVLWDLTILRPRAVWRAHTNAILGITAWGQDKIITHGRDHKLIIWKVDADDETRLSTTLPLDCSPDTRPQPWILHILEVNTMNFCSFGSCPASVDGSLKQILIAVPNTLASESVDIYKFPDQERIHTIHAPEKGEKSGMVMALALFHSRSSLTLVTAYENGLAIVYQQCRAGLWHLVYQANSHSQPVLSLDVAPSKKYFLTSSADSLLVKHPILEPADSCPHVDPPRILGDTGGLKPRTGKSLLSTALVGETRDTNIQKIIAPVTQTQPLKVVNTKHSGQQCLRIRSDGKIFATAGWDSKVRVYSAKTMKELAVLKWHQVGCYAVSFADVKEPGSDHIGDEPREKMDQKTIYADKEVIPRLVDVTVKEQRLNQAQDSHWLAAGSKDGRISVWDIY